MNNRGCFRLRARSGSPGSAAPRPSRTHRLVSVLDLDCIVTLPSHLCQVFSAKFITELWQSSSPFLSPVFRHFPPLPPVSLPFPAPLFVTNLLSQPVSDLFQFHPAFPLPSHLIFRFPFATFSLYFRVRSFYSYLLHTPRVFISFSNTTFSAYSGRQKALALR